MRLAVLIAFTLVSVHAEERKQRVDLEIPLQCVKTVTLKDCDLNVEPPKCAKSTVAYSPASCAIIHIVKE